MHAYRNDRVMATIMNYLAGQNVSPLRPDEMIDALDPAKIAAYLGIRYTEVDVITSMDAKRETAGTMDFTAKEIKISRRFPPDQRRFTGMHEIIHWILHADKAQVLHRDRAIDVSLNESLEYDPVEAEANMNASIELMPAITVQQVIEQLFGVKRGQRLILDENAAHRLGVSIDDIAKMSDDDKYRLIAATTVYGRPITPLHKVFKVSVDAMAYRLKRLNILTFIRRGKPILTTVRRVRS